MLGEMVMSPPGSRYRPDVPVPARVRNVLVRARKLELEATGTARRGAHRLMRDVLGGAIEAGYSIEAVAACVQASAESVRGRASRGSWLAASEVLGPLGIRHDTLARWRESGRLPSERVGERGELFYASLEIVSALGANAPPHS